MRGSTLERRRPTTAGRRRGLDEFDIELHRRCAQRFDGAVGASLAKMCSCVGIPAIAISRSSPSGALMVSTFV
jgi:hypothetical protein